MALSGKNSGSSMVSVRSPYTSLTILDIPASSSVTDINILADSLTKYEFSSGYGFGSALSSIASKNALYCSIEALYGYARFLPLIFSVNPNFFTVFHSGLLFKHALLRCASYPPGTMGKFCLKSPLVPTNFPSKGISSCIRSLKRQSTPVIMCL
jgi:hypothetical protein